MKSRVQEAYLAVGRILNNPSAFGLGQRAPKALVDVLSKMRLELMEELKEEMSGEDYLAMELSQDADRNAVRGGKSKPFPVRKTGT